MVQQPPALAGLSKTLLAAWQKEGVFDFQSHMNDGDYQFDETLKLVNLTSETGNYVGQNNTVGGLGRLTTTDSISEGSFKNQMPNGYGRILDKDGAYYGQLISGLREGQGEQVYLDGKVDGGYWMKNKYVQSLKWYQLLTVFETAPDSVSSFALDRWKSLGPFDVRSYILDNSITVANRTTGVVETTTALGSYSGQPFSTSLPVGRTISKGSIYEGVLQDGSYNGYVRIIKPNGDFYTGFAKDNLPDGPGNFTRATGKNEIGYYNQGTYFETEYLYKLSALFEQEPKFASLKPEQIALWKKVGKFKLHEYIHQGKVTMPVQSQGQIGLLQDDQSVYYG